LGQPVGDPITIDGKTNQDFFDAYPLREYVAITPEEMARMPYEDFAQRFNDLVEYVRTTYTEVQIETTEFGSPLYVRNVSGFNNVIVESQGYYEDSTECPTEFGTCYLLEVPSTALQFENNTFGEYLYVTYQPPGGELQDAILANLPSVILEGSSDSVWYLCSKTIPEFKYGSAGSPFLSEEWTTDLQSPCYSYLDCGNPEEQV
jgi:hypothetical protein